jgi:hypothetical protein
LKIFYQSAVKQASTIIPVNIPFKQSPCEASCSKKKGVGVETALPSFSILIPYVNYSAITFENTVSVSGQASINPSSLPTVPLNRARVRTAVQRKRGG